MAKYSYKKLLLKRKAYWDRTEKVTGRALKNELTALRGVNHKLKAYRFAKENAIDTPAYQEFESIEALFADTAIGEQGNPDNIHPREWDKMVIKPRGGHSSNGVYLLKRLSQGGYFCEMNQKTFASKQEIIQSYHRQLEKRGNDAISKAVILEEYMHDSLGFEIPLDYKVYTFPKGTPVIMQRYAANHLPSQQWRFEFYDVAGNRLGKIRSGTDRDAGEPLPPPKDIDRLCQTALKLIKQSKTSFLRVDLYETDRGVVLGEFTPLPNDGKERFDARFDEILGEYWHYSLKQLGVTY